MLSLASAGTNTRHAPLATARSLEERIYCPVDYSGVGQFFLLSLVSCLARHRTSVSNKDGNETSASNQIPDPLIAADLLLERLLSRSPDSCTLFRGFLHYSVRVAVDRATNIRNR
ncbi:hypothetical protein V1291_000824 [Nitrobacteraceae bacterium AZCC 1564]